MDIFRIITLPGWLVTIFFVPVTFVIIFTLFSIYCHTIHWRLGIPGPKPTLILGNLMMFIKKGVFNTDIENTQKYGKLWGIYAGNLYGIVCSDVDIIKQMCIKDFSKFPNRVPPGADKDPAFGGALTITRDERWKLMRTIISPTFSSGKMRQMTPLLQKCAEDLIDKLVKDTENGEPVDVCTYCGSYSMDVIASTAFGIDVDAQNNKDCAFIKMAKKAFDRNLMSPFFMLIMFFPFTRKLLPYFKISSLPKDVGSFFTTAVNSVIEERNTDKKSRQDLMGLLLNAHKDIEQTEDEIELQSENKMDFKKRKLTNHEIMANALVFFLAGYETTANVLSFILYCLAIYPEYAEIVRREIDTNIGKDKPAHDNVSKLTYLDMFVCEVLRLYGSAARFNRIVEEDSVIGGYKIPKGTDFQFAICAIHRDSELWPEPEVFDPQRFTPENKAKRHPYAWVPFGIGPRNCVGMRFALTELKMGAVAIVQKFNILRCDETEVPITFHKGGFIKAANGIKLKLQKRTDIE